MPIAPEGRRKKPRCLKIACNVQQWLTRISVDFFSAIRHSLQSLPQGAFPAPRRACFTRDQDTLDRSCRLDMVYRQCGKLPAVQLQALSARSTCVGAWRRFSACMSADARCVGHRYAAPPRGGQHRQERALRRIASVSLTVHPRAVTRFARGIALSGTCVRVERHVRGHAMPPSGRGPWPHSRRHRRP